MFFRKSSDELTDKLEKLFIQEPNPKRDKKTFTLATQLVDENVNNHKALYILAQCYHFGIGTSVNYEKAVELYDTLSKNENFDSDDANFQFKFASVLQETNNSRCLVWYFHASLNGDQYSTFLIGSLLLDGDLMINVPYINRYELATKFLQKAIQMNDDYEITEIANDLLIVMQAKHKINILEIEKQNKIFSLLNE